MPVGDKFAFLQFSATRQQTLDTAGVTMTFCSNAQPDPSVWITNHSTATVFIALTGSNSTSSAAVTSAGICIYPAAAGKRNEVLLRTGGVTTLAAFTVGATQTTVIRVTGGEGASLS